MDPSAAYKDPKQEKDLAAAADAAIASAENYAAAQDMANATAVILSAEKECRNASDGASGSRLCVWLLNALLSRGLLKEGCEWIIALSKKRAQLKRVQKEVVREGMEWIKKPWPQRSDLYTLIETLCTVTEGKIFLELERARIIMTLAHLKEEEGLIETAADVLQDVQVESNIYMDKFEKGRYITEQMRLVIKKKDWIRCQIISKKINKTTLDSEGFEYIKLSYYSYLLQYYNHLLLTTDTSTGHEMADCFRNCLDTDFDKISDEDFQKLRDTQLSAVVKSKSDLHLWFLSSLIVALALSEESPEKIDALQRILVKYEKVLRTQDELRQCAEQLVDNDVTPYSPAAQGLMQHPLLANDDYLEGSEKRRELLRLACLRHNLVVIAKFYKRSTLPQLARLMNFSVDDTEEQLCTLILNRNITAKINRPAGLVVFNQKNEVAAVTEWSQSITSTLDALCEVCNLIEKEVN